MAKRPDNTVSVKKFANIDGYKILIKMKGGTYADVEMIWTSIKSVWVIDGYIYTYRSGARYQGQYIEKIGIDNVRGLSAYLQTIADKTANAYKIADSYRKKGWLNNKGDIVRSPNNPLARQ